MYNLSDNALTDKQLTYYRNKGHRTRFFKVYFFVVRWTWKFFWHFRIRSLYSDPKTRAEIEKQLFFQLGKQAKVLFLQLGGVYIKAGQFLSSLAHIFPANFTDELKDLQDRVPAHPFPEIRERFFHEFNKNIEEVFPDIDRVPLAAASTAQVHTASIGGRKVAIKILYPGIEELIRKDLETIQFVMKWIDSYFYDFDYKSIYVEIEEIVQREMDLEEEGKSIQKMADFFRKEKDFVFPKVYTEYSTKGILVTRFIEGMKITETRINHKKGGKPSRPLELLIKAYILMVFKYRFFHADPHSGNIIYTPQGKLCFIDFGAVAEIPESTAASLRKMITNAIKEDFYAVVEAMGEMGFYGPEVNREKLEQIAQFAFQKLRRFLTNTEYFQNISLDQLGPEEAKIFLEGINSSLKELMKVTQIPRNYVMLERVMGLIAGISAVLDPYRTVFDYAEPHFYSILEERKREFTTILKEEGNEIAVSVLEIPAELKKTLIALNRGRIRLINREMEKHTEKMYALGHQFIYTIFAIAGLHYGNYFYQLNKEWLAGIFLGVTAAMGVNLIRSFLKNRTTKL
jgi:predicted unusual protein kinase regulating ubiquinone biosynthesis (AarF/ABC1/UbiB family)